MSLFLKEARCLVVFSLRELRDRPLTNARISPLLYLISYSYSTLQILQLIVKIPFHSVVKRPTRHTHTLSAIILHRCCHNSFAYQVCRAANYLTAQVPRDCDRQWFANYDKNSASIVCVSEIERKTDFVFAGASEMQESDAPFLAD